MFNKPYISSCPIGCSDKMKNTKIFLPEGYLLQCPICGHFISQCSEYLYNKSIKDEFNDSKGTWPTGERESRLIKRTKKDLSKIESLLAKNRKAIRLLDVGCSTGSFIYIAKQLGVKVEGVEPAEKAANAAIELGLNVYHGFLQDIGLQEDSYDIITLFEVIEHINDPLSLLKECHRLLRSNGILFIRTGNTESWTVKIMKGNWHYFNIDKHGGHISFFNPKSIKKLSAQTGFTIEKLNTHSVSFCNKEEVSYLTYRLSKIITELLNIPAKFSGYGHEMEVFLRKQVQFNTLT